MRNHHSLKTRYGTHPTETGTSGLRDILCGIFGIGKPVIAPVTSVPGKSFYQYFQADLFTPGTGNYVLDPSLETPLATAWGHGFLCRANAFEPLQRPQVYAYPNAVQNGIGGLVAGQRFTLPLTENPLPEQGA